MNHEMCLHREEALGALLDQSTYSVGPSCIAHKPIPYEGSECICLSTIKCQPVIVDLSIPFDELIATVYHQ